MAPDRYPEEIEGARPGPFRQAVLVLRWFRERGCVHRLARDASVSRATGYRYLHEGTDVLTRMFNTLLRHVRALDERTAALVLKGVWR